MIIGWRCKVKTYHANLLKRYITAEDKNNAKDGCEVVGSCFVEEEVDSESEVMKTERLLFREMRVLLTYILMTV